MNRRHQLRPAIGAPAHLRSTGAQDRCDAIQAAFRASGKRPSIRRDAPPLPPPIEPTGDQLMLRLAEELDYARRMLDQMGDALCADMTVVMRHPIALQSIDVVGQMLGQIANVVRAGDQAAAVDRIGMSDLKARLTRSGGL